MQTDLTDTLRVLEATEANLGKLERVWKKMLTLIPSNISFDENPEYEVLRMRFADLQEQLPAIDGWHLPCETYGLSEIAEWRLDAHEAGELSMSVETARKVNAPSQALAEYRYRFDRKRRGLIRQAALELVGKVDAILSKVDTRTLSRQVDQEGMDGTILQELRHCVDQLDILFGSSMPRPPRWTDLQRHLAWGENHDLKDIVRLDWPAVRPAIDHVLFGEDEPLPVRVHDLGELVASKAGDAIPTALSWDRLTAGQFERVVFAILDGAKGYEDLQWLTHTTAPDRGRDISFMRIARDDLAVTRRERAIVQCRHWLSRSVGVQEVTALQAQMKLWEPPRVDQLIIATSGRFTTDAIALIDKVNGSDSALRLEMWPESHLERLLSKRPGLIAEFGLR